jgi:hypothetical protein
VLNTFPEGYLYTSKSTFVKVANAGIYEVVVGIFALEPPEVELVVNGQPCLRRRKGDWHKQHAQCAYTLRAHIFLQELSLLSVGGQPGGEAFFYIRRG